MTPARLAELEAVNAKVSAALVLTPSTPAEWAARHIAKAEAHEASLAKHEAWMEAASKGNPGLPRFYRLSADVVAATKAAEAMHRRLAAEAQARRAA